MLPMPIDFKLKNEFGPPIIVPNSNVSKNNLKNWHKWFYFSDLNNNK